MIAFAAAIWVHPTNVFAGPLLVVPLLRERREQWMRAWHTVTLPCKTWGLAALVLFTAVAIYAVFLGLRVLPAHVHGPSDWGLFAANYLRLFSAQPFSSTSRASRSMRRRSAGIAFCRSHATWGSPPSRSRDCGE